MAKKIEDDANTASEQNVTAPLDLGSAGVSPASSEVAETKDAGETPALPSALLVKIVRVDREDGPLIRLPYESASPSTEHWDFAFAKNTFEVSPEVAAAAIASGFFRADE